jgi:hypothetical protein
MATREARSWMTRETILSPLSPLSAVRGTVRMVGGFRSEPWAASNQNAGRHQIGMFEGSTRSREGMHVESETRDVVEA